MLQKTRHACRSGPTFLLILLCLFALLPTRAQATDRVFEGHIELSGEFDRQFSLTPSDLDLFHLEKVVPGDTWRGKITVTNRAFDKMEIAIISIVSNLTDTTLYDALDLDISLSGETIYSGSYGATEEPISAFYAISPGRSLTFDVTVTLPKEVGNEVQDKEMDSTWTFEGRYYGSHDSDDDDEVKYYVYYVDEDGNPLLDTKVGWGEIGEKVTEYAPEITGYVPDKESKSIILKSGRNEITFIYKIVSIPINPDEPTPPEPDVPPVEPEQPQPPNPSEPVVQTGMDMTQSNTGLAFWLVMAGMCVLIAMAIFYRIKLERIQARKEARGKEGKYHAEK